MTLAIREASGLTDIGGVSVREASGLTAISEIWVREAAGLVKVFSSFSDAGLSVVPTSAFGYTTSHASQRINTYSVTVTVSPAGPVDSVVWTFDDIGWEALSPGSLTTAFRSPSVGPSDTETTIATCTVTRGAVVATIGVTLSCSNFGT